MAAVFINRLQIAMPLQTDPTVIYGLGERFDGNLRKVDLLTDTPFNTYTRTGLPPTPIAMPGKASLLAAVRPADQQCAVFRRPRRRQQRLQRRPGGAQPGGQPVPARQGRLQLSMDETGAGGPQRSRGRFITVEGIDGAGKSQPHRRRWSSACSATAAAVVATREPGGTPLAETLRGLLLEQPMDALTETLLVFAARRDHLQQRDRAGAGARRNGASATASPMPPSPTRAAGAASIGACSSQLEHWVHGDLQPDLTLWFDLPPKPPRRAAARRAQPDRFEQQDAGFFDRVRSALCAALRRVGGRIVRIDAAPEPAAVWQQIAAVLDQRGW